MTHKFKRRKEQIQTDKEMHRFFPPGGLSLRAEPVNVCVLRSNLCSLLIL